MAPSLGRKFDFKDHSGTAEEFATKRQSATNGKNKVKSCAFPRNNFKYSHIYLRNDPMFGFKKNRPSA
jgi:hypothetical protein